MRVHAAVAADAVALSAANHTAVGAVTTRPVEIMSLRCINCAADTAIAITLHRHDRCGTQDW